MTEQELLVLTLTGTLMIVLVCAFAAVGLALITHGVPGAERVYMHVFGPIEKALGFPFGKEE